MKKADLNALEKTLAHLPVDLKQRLANQLLGQINAQAHTLLERPDLTNYVLIAAMSTSLSGGILVVCRDIVARA